MNMDFCYLESDQLFLNLILLGLWPSAAICLLKTSKSWSISLFNSYNTRRCSYSVDSKVFTLRKVEFLSIPFLFNIQRLSLDWLMLCEDALDVDK